MSLFSNSKYTKRLFRQVGGVVWDLTTGKTGIKTDDAIHTFSLVKDGDNEFPQVTANLFEQFGLEIPAFASNVKLENVKAGDVIVGANNLLGWVVKVNGKSINYHSFDGHSKTYTPPKVDVLGIDGQVQIVQGLTDLLGDNTGSFQSMIGPLLLLSKEDGNTNALTDKLPLFLLMAQSGQAGSVGDASNPMAAMLPLMLLGGDKGGSLGDKLPLLMMSGALGGGNAAGGLGGMLPLLLLSGDGGLGGGDMMEKMIMMQALGGQGGQGGQGGLNPMLMLALLGDKPSASAKAAPVASRSTPALAPLVTPKAPPLTRI